MAKAAPEGYERPCSISSAHLCQRSAFPKAGLLHGGSSFTVVQHSLLFGLARFLLTLRSDGRNTIVVQPLRCSQRLCSQSVYMNGLVS